MPFIKTPEFAADKMFKGLTKTKAFEIHFPKELTLIINSPGGSVHVSIFSQ